MKKIKRNLAKFSNENLNGVEKLNLEQMVSLIGGQTMKRTNPVSGIVPVPDVSI